MSIHLRQVALIAQALEPVVDDLSAIFDLKVCYVDEAVAEFGLKNALLAIGDSFIEVVSPIVAGTAGGRYLQRRGGDGGYMVITQARDTQEQAACRRAAVNSGTRIAWEKSHQHGNYMQLHPRDMRACFLEIDSTLSSDPSFWPPAGGDEWRSESPSARCKAITAVEIQCDDPQAVAEHWASIIGEQSAPHSDGCFAVMLGNATIRFVAINDGRGAGLGGLDILVTERESILADARARDCILDEDKLLVGGVRIKLCEALTA